MRRVSGGVESFENKFYIIMSWLCCRDACLYELFLLTEFCLLRSDAYTIRTHTHTHSVLQILYRKHTVYTEKTLDMNVDWVYDDASSCSNLVSVTL